MGRCRRDYPAQLRRLSIYTVSYPVIIAAFRASSPHAVLGCASALVMVHVTPHSKQIKKKPDPSERLCIHGLRLIKLHQLVDPLFAHPLELVFGECVGNDLAVVRPPRQLDGAMTVVRQRTCVEVRADAANQGAECWKDNHALTYE